MSPSATMVRSQRTTTAPSRVPAKRRISRWQRRERWTARLMTLPQVIPFITFGLIPIGWVVWISFTTYDGFGHPTFVGLQNYRLLWADSQWWHAVWVTFVFGFGKIIIEIPLALLLAVLLNKTGPGRGLFGTILFIPNCVSIAVMGIVFYYLLSPNSGAINEVLQKLHIISHPIDWLGGYHTALASLIGVGVWASLGLNTILFLVGLQTVPRELEESARIDGANEWQRFRHVALPALAPVLRVVVVLTLVFSMRSFDLVKTLTNGGPAGQTDVMFTYIFSYFFSSTRGVQFGYASAMAVVASGIISLVSLAYLAVSGPRFRTQLRHGTGAAR